MKHTHHRAIAALQAVSCVSAAALSQRQSSLLWDECKTVANTTTKLTCATLDVPLDYLDPSRKETLNLKLARAKATKDPFRGTVLFNPGGPGDAGRNALDTFDGLLNDVLGGHWDVVTWDFRGTGETLPFSCFRTETERSAYNVRLLDLATNASDTSIGEAWSIAEWMTAYCKNSTDALKADELIGTVYTARDMMQIVDALGEDDMLRYWGISYGTALGETAAAMFPERVDRVLLDAVLNPTEWWSGRSVSQLSDADKTFQSFCAECLRAPALCPLEAQAESAEELASKIHALIDEAKYQPVSMGVLGPQTYSTIRTNIAAAMYDPSGFPSLALYLNAVLTRNETQLLAYLTRLASTTSSKKPFPDYSPSSTKENQWGIRCSDELLRHDNLTAIIPLIEDFHAESKISGDITWTTLAMGCAQWPWQAKERWTAGFHDIDTHHPILFLANMYDPVTSVNGARNASASFPGSGLLINDGHGHSSLAQMSACTVRAIRDYFENGTLPKHGEVCPPTIPAFTTKTIADVLAEVDEDAE